ncbi:hypothetical protein MMC24_004662 [Lignoscripta atroalba]|nr:hypothetical protein [Lignoscripta atroalba]
MDSYSYSPLDPTSRQIRLLVLRPALRRSASIQCNLIQTSLDDNPTYEALSYTWGDPRITRTINLDGHNFLVTENLDDALRDIRHRTSKRTVWVDAVCVNQADVPERNHQVRQMRHIYEMAQQVLVWLGGETADSVKALNFIKEFNTKATRMRSADEVQSYLTGHSTDAGAWAALAAVLNRPCWTRAWIFQEVMVASKAEVYCGRQSVPWDLFSTLAFTLDKYEDLFRLHEPSSGSAPRVVGNYHHLYNIALFQRQRLMGAPPLLLETLQIRRSSLSTDPRDKVFAVVGVSKDNLVGLPKPAEGPQLQLDYSKAVSEVYKGVTRHLINKTGNLDVLCACQYTPRDDGLPSWAPDWSKARTNGPIQNPDQWGHLYSASDVASTMFLFYGRTWSDEDDDALRLQGVCIDTIEQLGTSHTYGADWADLNSEWGRLSLTCTSARPDGTAMAMGDEIPSDGTSLYFTGQSVAEAYGRTCMLDRLADLEDTEESRWKAALARVEAIENRRFYVTREGFMGLGPSEAQEGDVVCVLQGAHVPFVLRKVEDHHVLVEECYLHGFMNGEVDITVGDEWEEIHGGKLQSQEFILK